MMRLIAPAVLVLALAACGGDGAQKAQGGTAQGEVLPGSISDAMVPVDQVKSQAPLAPKSEGGEKPGTKEPAKAKSAPAAAVAAEAPAEEAAAGPPIEP